MVELRIPHVPWNHYGVGVARGEYADDAGLHYARLDYRNLQNLAENLKLFLLKALPNQDYPIGSGTVNAEVG
ncbi:hypothetical protein D1872_343340 [compost metagenome]